MRGVVNIELSIDEGGAGGQVGIPGRVWMKRQVEWHTDISALAQHEFLRKESAIKAGFRGYLPSTLDFLLTHDACPKLDRECWRLLCAASNDVLDHQANGKDRLLFGGGVCTPPKS
jgi:hypothetical protein